MCYVMRNEMIYQKYFGQNYYGGASVCFISDFLPKRHGFSNDGQRSSIGCADNAILYSITNATYTNLPSI